jgi:hypothetical protein
MSTIQAEIFAQHSIRPRRETFASPELLEDLRGLTPLEHAEEGKPSVLCIRTPAENRKHNTRPGIEPEIWSWKSGRLQHKEFADFRGDERAQIALPMVTSWQDQSLINSISATRDDMCWAKNCDRIPLRSFLISGLMVTAHWSKHLSLSKRRGKIAAAHLSAYLDVRIDPNLSSHEIIELLPRAELLLSDLASIGFSPCSGDVDNHTRHKVSLCLE